MDVGGGEAIGVRDRDAADDTDEAVALIGRIAAGEEAALRRLYDRTAPKLLGILVRILRDRSEAEDALQDVYVRVWQRAPSYVPAAGRPFPWLVAIARHRAIDAIRRRRGAGSASVSALDEEDPFARLADPRDGEADFVARDALRRCLARLEAPQRECLVLAYCEGTSREELAERYGRPVNTIKTWLRRGLASLRGCLEAA